MKDSALQLVKARVGLSTKIRDEYLSKIIEGIIEELERVQGLSLDEDNSHHLMFVVDLADWRYSNRDEREGMPRHLQYRLHNLIFESLSDADE